MRSRMAMVSAASGKRSNTERCTASTVRPPMIGVSHSRPSMVAVSLSVTSISSSPRASADNGTALAPAASAARKNLARVSRRDIAQSFIRHVAARCQRRKNSDRHIDAAPALFARVQRQIRQPPPLLFRRIVTMSMTTREISPMIQQTDNRRTLRRRSLGQACGRCPEGRRCLPLPCHCPAVPRARWRASSPSPALPGWRRRGSILTRPSDGQDRLLGQRQPLGEQLAVVILEALRQHA